MTSASSLWTALAATVVLAALMSAVLGPGPFRRFYMNSRSIRIDKFVQISRHLLSLVFASFGGVFSRTIAVTGNTQAEQRKADSPG
jgi:hypothetical protein